MSDCKDRNKAENFRNGIKIVQIDRIGLSKGVSFLLSFQKNGAESSIDLLL